MATMNAAEIRHSGTCWRAEMTDKVSGHCYGAANVTNYYRYDGRWKEISWESMPPAAYRALRKALRADVALGPAV